ncbi:MAG: hypothetical protein MJ244_03520 [Clostridia bacterium]|nr:hypothetical protein [Clostridia bacterium]
MNIEAIVFLIIIGIIVILTITDKSDVKNEGVIDFKTSHDVNGDIKKLKSKIKDDAKNARDTKRLFISLIVIISVILIGFIVVACDLIFRDNNVNNNINNDTNIVDKDKEEDKKDKEEKDKDKLDITLNKLGEVSDYIKESQEASPCDMVAIEKDINYHKQEILDGILEIYLVKDNKYTKLENPDTITNLLEDYFRSKSYKKLFTINGDGVLIRYIYICD